MIQSLAESVDDLNVYQIECRKLNMKISEEKTEVMVISAESVMYL